MREEALRRNRRLYLPIGEPDARKRYQMPDPDALAVAYVRIRESYYSAPGFGFLANREDTAALIDLASGYLTLTTYDLGQEACVAKLRDIWRARRADRARRAERRRQRERASDEDTGGE